MQPVWRGRLAAAILILGATALFAVGRPGSAIALLAAAAATLILVQDRSLPVQVASALQSGTLGDALGALRLEGQGVLQARDGQVMWFVPASVLPLADVPRWDGHTAVASRPPGVGIWLRPPGDGLYQLWRAQVGDASGGIEGAAAALKKALPALGLGRRVDVSRGQTLRVTYQPTLAGQTDLDAVPSFIGMVIAAATQRSVRLIGSDRVEAGLRLDWDVA